MLSFPQSLLWHGSDSIFQKKVHVGIIRRLLFKTVRRIEAKTPAPFSAGVLFWLFHIAKGESVRICGYNPCANDAGLFFDGTGAALRGKRTMQAMLLRCCRRIERRSDASIISKDP